MGAIPSSGVGPGEISSIPGSGSPLPCDGEVGFEPTTSGTRVQRYYQLSYSPMRTCSSRQSGQRGPPAAKPVVVG